MYTTFEIGSRGNYLGKYETKKKPKRKSFTTLLCYSHFAAFRLAFGCLTFFE